jgi:hypothetical protein
VGASLKELELLDWFRYHSTTNLHCAFGSKFWEDLTLRACLEEPAVFHAVLALSAVHKRFIFGMGGRAEQSGPEDALLQTYQFQRSKAVRSLLEPQPTTKLSKTAVRTALIACMIFTNMDFTLGQYESGRGHFHSGIKLLNSLRSDMPANPASPGSISDDGNSDADDMWIIEAFSHGNLNTAQFGICYWHPEPVPRSFCMPLPSAFKTTNQAKKSLDYLLSDTFKVMAQARGKAVFTDLDEHNGPKSLEKLRQRIKLNLESWNVIFERSLPTFEAPQLSLGLCILRMFYAMTTIMVDVCLRLDDVMAYDAHKQNFHTIIACGEGVLQAVKKVPIKDVGALKQERELYAFVPDGGWQSPLFFTALHCRVRRLRLHAIKYLYAVPAQEFIWNHKIAADVGREIMNIEHGLDHDPEEDNFNITDVPRLEELPDPNLPAEKRAFDVGISLYDLPARAILTYSKQTPPDGRQVFMHEYGLGHATTTVGSERMPFGGKQAAMGQDPMLHSIHRRT